MWKYLGNGNKSTREEAVALRKWADRHAASVLVMTEMFMARRVSWICQREFSGTTVSVKVGAFEPPGYTRKDWWKSEQGVEAFKKEVLELFYCRWKYAL